MSVGARGGRLVCLTRAGTPTWINTHLGIVLCLEALRRVEAVADVGDVDKATGLGYGSPMGSFELRDTIGLDVRRSISEYLERELVKAGGQCFHVWTQ